MPTVRWGKFEEKNSRSILDALLNLQSPSQQLVTQEVVVSTTPTQLPASPAPGRKSLVIRNADASATLKIGDQSEQNYSIEPKEFIALDLPSSLSPYGKVDSGTITIEILELS